MQLYHGSVSSFQADLGTGRLFDVLATRFAATVLSDPSPSEARSWHVSLPKLCDVLVDAGLSHVSIVLEYSLPLSSKRTDAILLGRDGEGQARGVVIELKSWDAGDTEIVDDSLIDLGGRVALNPLCQVAQYVEYLRDFNTAVSEGLVQLDGAAYLHESRQSDVDRFSVGAEVAEYPGFGADGVERLAAFLRERLSSDDGGAAADVFLDAPTRPSKRLLDHLSDEVAGNEQFTLLDEQLVALEIVQRMVDEARDSARKRVVIVTGGPGTGKSVIAARLVGQLARQGLNVSHATGSKSFTETLRWRVGARAGRLFRYFNSFAMADLNELDVLVCDEAHRIRESSNSRFTRRDKRSLLPQADELIQVAKVTVFLLDENQVVRPGEIGSVAEIESAARRYEAEIVRVDLDGQFRCMGSGAYIDWVERLLGLRTGEPGVFDKDEPFELVAVSTVTELEEWCEAQQNLGNTARLSAGFCWPWSDPLADGSLVDDVIVGSWSRPWNAKPGKRVTGAPPASLWASDPLGFGQVGCIYTAQGFEYDFNGVILGPDIRWDGDLVTDRSGNADPIVRKAADFDRLVRNTYKVLLTRGLRGCAIYAMDEGLRTELRRLTSR